MAKGCFKRIAIKGIACAVPDKIKTANYWYDIFGQEAVDKFVKMTGVKRVCQSSEEQTASDLAFVAAQALLKQKNIDPQSIGALIFISQCPDYRLPATACVLQYRLSLPEDCICFDVNLGCSGYVNGINIAASLMNASNINRALLLVGDTSSKGISHEDKSSAMLFGDAGGATLLEKDNESENNIIFHLRTDGSRFKAIIKPAGAYRNRNASRERVVWNVDGNVRSDYETYMNGADVFSFTISEVPKLIKEVMTNENTTVDDYDCFVMHQANLYILKQIAKKIKIPNTKMPVSMDRFGNTSVTSIPLTLADKYGGEVQKIKALMCGFGVGLSWGVVSTEINTADILPVIHTNDYFKEGGVSHD
jgi:3-oxoacyl-[acyl-carrier-protein] synthase-3